LLAGVAGGVAGFFFDLFCAHASPAETKMLSVSNNAQIVF
jgi:hypothetical protein